MNSVSGEKRQRARGRGGGALETARLDGVHMRLRPCAAALPRLWVWGRVYRARQDSVF